MLGNECFLRWTTGENTPNFSPLENISKNDDKEKIIKAAKEKRREVLNENPRRLGLPRNWKIMIGEKEESLN